MLGLCTENRIINNRYQISCKLGEGGMGTIYLATDILKANAQIAIKTIREKALVQKRSNALELFKQEYEVMTRLSHPNLIKVYDFGKDDSSGDYYIAMEQVKGQTIREILSKRILLSEDISLEIFVALLRAMEFIHSRGILYRDVKPENILIDLEETDQLRAKSVKLLDFGLADIGDKTKDVVKGTVNYMAPEVLKGRVDHLSDIFGLGVLFYELYSGALIYTDGTISSIISSLSNSANFKESISLSLDKIKNCNVRKIIQKMTEYQPEKRFQSCSVIIQAINQLTGSNFEIETHATKEAYVFGVNFVARKVEFADLNDFVNLPASNSLYLLAGSLGVGKTRIFLELKKYCRLKNISYYQGKCSSEITFEPFIAILTEMLLNCKEELILKYGAELKKIIPEHNKLAAIKIATTQDPKAERGLLVETVSNFIIEYAFITKEELQTDKTILFIDNLQWADELSLDVLSELLYKVSVNHLELLSASSLRICAAYRDEEHENIKQFIDVLHKKNRLIKHVLLPFSDDEVAEYIKAIFGKQNIHKSLLENISKIKIRVGGNPVFLQELVKKLVESNMIIKVKSEWALVKSVDKIDIPENLQQIISEKIKSLVLNHDERFALDLLALLTRTGVTMDFFIKLVRDYIKVDVKKLFDYLAKEEIHSFTNSEYHSTNNLISEVIKKEMPLNRKQRLHQHIANRMELIYKVDTIDIKNIRNDLLEDLAYHYANAGILDQDTFINKTAFYLEEAADRFVLTFANKNAIRHYEIILSIILEATYKNQPAITKKQLEILLKLGSVLQFTGKPDDALDCYNKAHNIAETLKSPRLIAGCNLKTGSVLTHKSRYDEAEICYNKSLAIFKELNDKSGIGETLFGLGVIQKNHGNYSQSIALNLEALTYFDKNNNKDKIANIYGVIGTVYLYQSEFEKAMEFYTMQMKLYQELDNKSEIARTVGNMGIIYFQQGTYDKAHDCYQKRMKTAEEIGDKMGATLALSNLASIYYEQKVFPKALTAFEKSLKAFEELDAKNECIRIAINIGGIYLSQNRYDKALACYKDNLVNAEKIGDKRLISACVSHIGDVYSTAGYYEKAMKYYLRDLEIKESLGDKSGISILYGNICVTLSEQEMYEEAFTAIDKAIAIDLDLNTKVHLMYHLSNKAEVLYNLGKYQEADKLNNESIKLNKDFDDAGLLYETKLLACKIAFKLGDDNQKYYQIRKLDSMITESTNQIHIAELNFQIYKLLQAAQLSDVTDSGQYLNKALSLFTILNRDNKIAKYKKIIAELERVLKA